MLSAGEALVRGRVRREVKKRRAGLENIVGGVEER